MNELALFAGAGGGILGGQLLGFRTVCAVEISPFRREVLLQSQLAGCLPRFPVWDDVRTFDGRPWRGCVDIITGGFPCQDISAAGKGAGIMGERSGLWTEFARIIGEVRPRFALVENSPVLTSRGLGNVLGDLAAMGYDARWGVLSAEDAAFSDGNPALGHLRERIWIFAVSDASNNRAGRREQQQEGGRSAGNIRASSDAALGGQPANGGTPGQGGYAHELCATADAEKSRLDERPNERESEKREKEIAPERNDWWESEPGLGRMVDGLANRVDRLSAIGDGQVPAVVRMAVEILSAIE